MRLKLFAERRTLHAERFVKDLDMRYSNYDIRF